MAAEKPEERERDARDGEMIDSSKGGQITHREYALSEIDNLGQTPFADRRAMTQLLPARPVYPLQYARTWLVAETHYQARGPSCQRRPSVNGVTGQALHRR